MEKEFNTQICTTIEQSERLLALGVRKETADLHYCVCNDGQGDVFHILLPCVIRRSKDVPAWSLHRLIEIVECDMQTEGRYVCLAEARFAKYDNLFDNMIDCIEWLIKVGYTIRNA